MSTRAMPGVIGSELAKVRTYYFTDPVDHLKLKVELRRQKIHSTNIYDTKDVHRDTLYDNVGNIIKTTDNENMTVSKSFHWQEKVFSPKEIVIYSKMAGEKLQKEKGVGNEVSSSSHSSLSKHYANIFKEKIDGGRTPIDNVSNTMIFNYVDKDGYVPTEEYNRTFTTSRGELETPLSENILRLSMRNSNSANNIVLESIEDIKNDALKQSNFDDMYTTNHLRRDIQCKSMYILAALDVNKEACKTALNGSESDVSALAYETQVICSIKLYSSNGKVGRLDVTPAFSTTLLEQEEEEVDAEAMGQSSPRRARLSLAKGTKDPLIEPIDDITKAHRNSDAPVVVIDGTRWYRITSKSGIRYEFCIRNEGAILDRKMEDLIVQKERQKELRLYKSLRNRVGTSIDGAPPPGYNRMHIFGEIVSAIDFSGTLLHVQHELILPIKGWEWPNGTTPERIKSLTAGITQAARVIERPPGYLSSILERTASTAVAHFAYPIEFELLKEVKACEENDEFDMSPPKPSNNNNDMNAKNSESKSYEAKQESEYDIIQSMRTPQILFLVFSVDELGRHRVEGYGRHEIPRTPGYFDFRVQMWKPEASVRDRMAEFFLGGNRELGDLQFIASPIGLATFLNNYGFQVKSTGYVRIRLNVVWQGRPAHEVGETPVGSRAHTMKNVENTKNQGYMHLLSGLKSVRLSSSGTLQSKRAATPRGKKKTLTQSLSGNNKSVGLATSLLKKNRSMDMGSITARLAKMQSMRKSLNLSKNNIGSDETKKVEK